MKKINFTSKQSYVPAETVVTTEAIFEQIKIFLIRQNLSYSFVNDSIILAANEDKIYCKFNCANTDYTKAIIALMSLFCNEGGYICFKSATDTCFQLVLPHFDNEKVELFNLLKYAIVKVEVEIKEIK